MDSRQGKIKMSGGGDRLSTLPDDIIRKIFSSIDTKPTVAMSVLSSRWRYIWTSMPRLSFSSDDFRTLPEFCNFVEHVLSRRNNEIEVSSVKLSLRGKVSQEFLKRVLDYAFSHNVQELNITCLRDETSSEMTNFPPSFKSQSLKHLTLTGCFYNCYSMTPRTWKLPALATLNLDCVTLYDDSTDKCAGLFTNFANLKNLTLKNFNVKGLNNFRVRGSTDFSICHPGLSSLTLERGSWNVDVVTPQLKHLTIKYCEDLHLISAPNLFSLHYKDHHFPLEVSANLPHLEKVDICVSYPLEGVTEAQKVVSLLQQVHSVKFLTLNLELVKLLSSSLELLSNQPSPFANLKNLKIYPADLNQPEVTMSTEVKNYLLDGSPGATFTIVSHEEIRALMNFASARNLMGELQVLLDQWKENSEVDTAQKQQDEAPMESYTPTVGEQGKVDNEGAEQDNLGERMTDIKSYWEDLKEQFKNEYKNTRCTISMLRKIETVVAKLPRSHQDKLKARFFGLLAEAETIIDNMIGPEEDPIQAVQISSRQTVPSCLLV